MDGQFFNDGAAKRFSVTIFNGGPVDLAYQKPWLTFEDGNEAGLCQSVLREIDPPRELPAGEQTVVRFRIEHVSSRYNKQRYRLSFPWGQSTGPILVKAKPKRPSSSISRPSKRQRLGQDVSSALLEELRLLREEVREGRSEIQQLRREVRKLSSGRMEEGTEDEATNSHQVSPSPSPPELPQQPLPPADFEHPPLERGASEGVLAALGIGVASQGAEADEEFGDHLVDAMEWLRRMKQEG